MKKVLYLFLFLSTLAFSQQRFVVSPNNEVVQLQPHESASQVIQKIINERETTSSDNCVSRQFGYPIDEYLPTTSFTSRHKDIMAMWFVAPSAGTVDTLFWLGGPQNGALDSTIHIRIHESKIGLGSGPGYNFPHGCQNWGYWNSTNDLDMGVAAFPDDATDTTWISTITLPSVSYPPVGEELWGLGGYPVFQQPNNINTLPLDGLGSPVVTKGQSFWVSMRINSTPEHMSDNPTMFYALDNTGGALAPSRAWKFYEHDNGPSNCGGTPNPKRGWVARGGPTPDSSSAYAWNWWYSMTVTSDLPPGISNTTELRHTTKTSERAVVAEIEDCNAEKPESAGVASAHVLYSIDHGTTWDSVPMSLVGGNTWRGYIPAMNGNMSVEYKVNAMDLRGNYSEGRSNSYRILSLDNQYYSLDTTVNYQWHPIDTSGTKISGWFDRFIFAQNPPQDNGTAGPIDIGFEFPFFGEQVRYAWIGVNGGLSLSSSPNDTIDVFPDYLNCSGDFASIPSDCNPRNYINIFGYDFVVKPYLDNGEGYGAVFYKNETDKFIVEWNKVGNFVSFDDTNTTFQVILDKHDSSITFQYQSVGAFGIEYASFIGLQAEPTSKWFAMNILGYPLELKPANNKAFRFVPSQPNDVRDEEKNLPATTRLYQNYPNPFNPTTNFGFRISDFGMVTLKIYDVLGREVVTLLNEEKHPGEYSIPWNAEQVPSGVYYYKLTSGKFVETKTMIVIQ
ncbi:MAG: T9SS type A sorting domain-containing protein [Ignavibacteriae bacterium]|nr:T9SS type A sorting domain-containing protein [Ignavibacteriota bacterium]